MVVVEGLGRTGLVGCAWVYRVWDSGFLRFGIQDLGFRCHGVCDLGMRDWAYFWLFLGFEG